MSQTRPPEYFSKHSPEYVARAYLDSLWCRRVGGKAYDKPLVEAFMDLMQAPIHLSRSADSKVFYMSLLRRVVVPEARRLRTYTSPSPLRDALGIVGRSAFLPFALTLLFLRESSNSTSMTGQLFNQCWQSLSPALQQDIKAARSGQLARLRFHLMAHEELRFLASARLMSDREVAADPGGYGAVRIGVAGYSHIGREVVLFALLDELFGGTFLEVIGGLGFPADDGGVHIDDAPELDALFDYILVPIALDLGHILVKRRTWRPDSPSKSDLETAESHIEHAAEGMYDSTPQGVLSDPRHHEFRARMDQILNPEEQGSVPLTRIKEELSALRQEYAWMPEADIGMLDQFLEHIEAALSLGGNQLMTLGEFRLLADLEATGRTEKRGIGRKSKSLGKNKDAERISCPLFENDPEVQSLYDAATLVMTRARSALDDKDEDQNVHWVVLIRGIGQEIQNDEHTIPEVVQATLEEMLRLWFGLQLLSMLKERRYPAEIINLFLGDLQAIFKTLGDHATGDALSVGAYTSDGKQIFGERFVKERNKLIDSTVAGCSFTDAEQHQLDVVREHLEGLRKYRGVIGPVPTLQGKGAMSLIRLNAWVEMARWRAESGVTERTLGASAALESLKRTLESMFKSRPCDHLSDGLVDVGTFVKFHTGVDAKSRNGLHVAQNKLLELMADFKRKGFAGRPERLQTALIASTVVELVNDCLAMPDSSEAPLDRTATQSFFKWKYAQTQQRGDQEMWLYVAFKIAHTPGFEMYRDVYERVSGNVGEWHSSIKLSALYHELLQLDDLQKDIRTVFETVIQGQGDES